MESHGRGHGQGLDGIFASGWPSVSLEPGRRICGSTQAELRKIANYLLQCYCGRGRDSVIFKGPNAEAEKSRLLLARQMTRIPHAFVQRKRSFKGGTGISTTPGTTSMRNYPKLHLRSAKADKQKTKKLHRFRVVSRSLEKSPAAPENMDARGCGLARRRRVGCTDGTVAWHLESPIHNSRSS